MHFDSVWVTNNNPTRNSNNSDILLQNMHKYMEKIGNSSKNYTKFNSQSYVSLKYSYITKGKPRFSNNRNLIDLKTLHIFLPLFLFLEWFGENWPCNGLSIWYDACYIDCFILSYSIYLFYVNICLMCILHVYASCISYRPPYLLIAGYQNKN